MEKKRNGFLKKLLSTFKVEAAEHVQTLSSGLIDLEKATTAEARAGIVETVFREAHSLKGAARAISATEIEQLCQSLESVFAGLKRESAAVSPALFDLLHKAVDTLGRLLPHAGSESPNAGSASVADLKKRLDVALKEIPASGARRQTKPAPRQAALPPDAQQPSVEEKPALADTIRVSMAKLDSLLLQTEELLSAKLAASQRAGELRELIAVFGAYGKRHAKIDHALSSAQRWLKSEGKRNGSGKENLPLRRLLQTLAQDNKVVKSLEGRLAALAHAAEHDYRSLGGMVDHLLDDMKKASMLPLSSVLELLPKLIRDLSRDQGKEVDLVIQGEGIEVDRRILEEMKDPLIHLVRNCINHGIEGAEDRQRKLKPPVGSITLNIAQKDGGRIEIRVADDGAGIDVPKVRGVAQKLGIVTAEEAQSLDDNGVLSLIFRSGVSTSPIITDISGRGLGLAIVREKVEKLNGVIAVESHAGAGTVFSMVLPLTLATFRGVQVGVRGRSFILPTTQVEQVARVNKDDIKTVENRETIRLNGQVVSLVRLADVLELPTQPEQGADGTVPVVVLGWAERRIAFLVDEILDEQEVLVKGLGNQLSRVRNIAGATVLGTGKVVPILNVPDLIKSALKTAVPGRAAAVAQREKAGSRPVLLVEDSVTARVLLKNILEAAGYRVLTAVDGIDAFTALKTERIDIVVSDVEMPRMDGFDLTAKIRADKALVDLPVVLVTALESREHRERGVDVGANAYIVKSSFDQSNLLEVIKRLL